MRKNIAYLSLAVIILLILEGCKTPAQTSSFSKRYKSLQSSEKIDDDKSLVEISLDILPKNIDDKDSPKTIYDLKGQGQKALIDQYGSKTKEADKLKDLINQKYLIAEKDKVLNLTIKDLTLQFSVAEKEFYHHLATSLAVGDRIEHLKIIVTIDTPFHKFLRFTNWNRFTTQFGEFNISSLSFTTSKEIIVNPSIPVAGSSLSLGSYDRKKELTETDSLKREYILFNGTLHDNYFTIEQTGTPEKNLAGNSAVDLSVKFSNIDELEFFSFDKLSDESKIILNDPDQVKMEATFTEYPQLISDITATLTFQYEIRHIISGDETYSEGDDVVKYYYGSHSQKVEKFIGMESLKPKSWGIQFDKKNYITVKRIIDDKPQELAFSSYEDAKSFLEWLKYKTHTLKGDLVISEYSFFTDGLTGLKKMDKSTDIKKLDIILNP